MNSRSRQVLIVDDDPRVCEVLTLYLAKEDFAVLTAGSGREALSVASREEIDLIILDIMLPEMDGWEVCRTLRQRGLSVPIIMLTAKTEDYDKILGLDLGADDYVEKPFNPAVVVSRVRAVLRRTASGAGGNGPLSHPGLEIDPQRYEVRLQGRSVEMTPREVELLTHLARNPNRVFSREQLLEQVWGYDYTGADRTIDVHIKHIRDKLRPKTEATLPWRIKTIWGVGYKFALSVNENGGNDDL